MSDLSLFFQIVESEQPDRTLGAAARVQHCAVYNGRLAVHAQVSMPVNTETHHWNSQNSKQYIKLHRHIVRRAVRRYASK